MAFFDQFGAAQANNGQGPPNPMGMANPQMTENFRLGGPGYQPPNLAGGLQAFLANRNIPPNVAALLGHAQSSAPSALASMLPPMGGAAGGAPGGAGGAPMTPIGIPPSAQMGPGLPSGFQGGAPFNPGAAPANNNMAGLMRPFLR
jgi:hypothetical protein